MFESTQCLVHTTSTTIDPIRASDPVDACNPEVSCDDEQYVVTMFGRPFSLTDGEARELAWALISKIEEQREMRAR